MKEENFDFTVSGADSRAEARDFFEPIFNNYLRNIEKLSVEDRTNASIYLLGFLYGLERIFGPADIWFFLSLVPDVDDLKSHIAIDSFEDRLPEIDRRATAEKLYLQDGYELWQRISYELNASRQADHLRLLFLRGELDGTRLCEGISANLFNELDLNLRAHVPTSSDYKTFFDEIETATVRRLYAF